MSTSGNARDLPSLADDIREQYAIIDTLEAPENQPQELIDALQVALDSACDRAMHHHMHLAELDGTLRDEDSATPSDEARVQVGVATRQAHELLQVLDEVRKRTEAFLSAYHNVLRPNLDIAMANSLAMMARQQQQLQFTQPVEPTASELPLDVFNFALYPDSLTHRPRAEVAVAQQTLSPYK